MLIAAHQDCPESMFSGYKPAMLTRRSAHLEMLGAALSLKLNSLLSWAWQLRRGSPVQREVVTVAIHSDTR